MNEMILEKMVQKMANLMTDVNEVNLLIRGLKPTQEVLNALTQRLDSMQGAMTEMLELLKTLDGRMAGMEEQLKSLKATLTTFGESIRELPEKMGMSPTAVQGIVKSMDQLRWQLEQPQQEVVINHHHLHKGVLITIATGVVCIVLGVFLVNSYSRIDLEKERDLKYRYMQVSGYVNLENTLLYVDSLYRADPVQFFKQTVEMEERRERTRQLLEQNARNGEELRQIQGK